MGKLFQTNTWRAPLRLIECWLPEPGLRPSQPATLTSTLVDKFSRAGWLKSHAANAPCLAPTAHVSATSPKLANTPRVRVVWTRDKHTRTSARVVVAGRINDVCAELDRLAELERRQAKAA
ncbi:hypothetical protein [Hydrogenophaga sp.]|uniref:hypothetical protein n=1 Tax=Hydrogenophaga sp. TaxID=1904254 RepID=UPI0035ADCDC6